MSQDVVATEFEQHRARLVGVAYRILGSVADAEDVVQDAWLRLARSDRDVIEELGAWLTTVTSRLCLDRLRSARATRETYVGPWLPEPVVRQVDAPPGPADLAELDESVRMALLVVLEDLTPEQRVAFILHDVFAVPFAEVGQALATTSAAARQLASRARRAVREAAPAPRVPMPQQREVMAAFQRAASAGDLDGLLRCLAPDAVLRSDGGGLVSAALRPVVGAEKVARFVVGIRAMAGSAHLRLMPALVNGELGMVVEVGPGPDSRAEPGLSVIVPRVEADGLVHGIDIVRNPAKLRHLAGWQDQPDDHLERR